MVRKFFASRTNTNGNGRKHHGFTLVELIVVLAILAIIATIGGAVAVGYIRRSKLDKNNQNAKTVYQTAQTAITKKTANGSITSWVMGLNTIHVLDVDSELDFPADSSTDYSAHKTIALTYNHNSPEGEQDKYLYDLLSQFFYDKSIFNGTITVEFDICKTKSNDKFDYFEYSVNVLSAFYSAENNAASGWENKYLAGDGLPNRDGKEYVGYYDGRSGGSESRGISSVAIPWDPTYELQGHIIGPTEDHSEAAGYLFNVRNGETLEVSWALFDADGDFYEAHENHNEDLHIVLQDEDDISVKTDLYINHSNLESVSYDRNKCYTTWEVVDGSTICRQSWNGFVNVGVKRKGETDQTSMLFPITMTLVTGDDRTGCPVDTAKGYYEYSLTLDAMMSRGTNIDSNKSNNRQSYFCAERLFKSTTPRNISAILWSDSTWKYYDDAGVELDHTGLVSTYAARAINDPVYFYSSTNNSGHVIMNYMVRENCAKYDGEDDTSNAEYIVTGKAVVNTFYGDKVYDTSSGSSGATDYIGGTNWQGTQKEAVLTNCRHLYNIRWMTTNDTALFRIVSDINWYYHSGDYYSSEVKVFPSASQTSFNSPVGSDGKLQVVSFPAINKFPVGITLTSISDSDSRCYSINGIQLRKQSFINNTDVGYALFCVSYGTIYNVYVDNLSLILANVPDGSECDYNGGNSGFCPENPVTIGYIEGDLNDCPVGSLVGYNRGIIGSVSETDDSINTVRVTNSIVMAGDYWNYSKCKYVGGVIGRNEGKTSTTSTYGLIQTGGRFVVLGNMNAGGIIGYTHSDISARLVVDYSEADNSEFAFPTMAATGKQFSCAVIANNRAGGAIGYFGSGTKFTRDVERYKMSGPNTETGELSFTNPDNMDFHIHVTLPTDSFILHLNGSDLPCVGGAIGYLESSSGSYLAIHTDISGYVTSLGSNDTYCGGAIGRELNCSINTIYLDCDNQKGSLIGGSGSVCSGGAYGRINTNTNSLDRKIVANVFNNGTISSRGTENGYGTGGAIGGADNKLVIPLIIRVVNHSDSLIEGTGSDDTNTSGTGGAVGGLGHKDNNNTYLPEGTVVYVENHGTISGHYKVGGAIGNAPLNRGSIYAVNTGTIEGDDFVGGAVGRSIKSQFGIIQSIMDGGTVKGNHFVGGAAGRLLYFQKGAVVRTYVRKSSTIHGTGSLIGGVCGDILLNNSNVGGTIELKGSSTNPILTIKGGDNSSDTFGVGGVAGTLRTQTADKIDVVSPTQKDLNRLAIHVDGQNDVGGVIGRLVSNTSIANDPSKFAGSSSAVDFSIELDVVLNPQSFIYGSGNNVGGAIGYVLSSGGNYIGSIDVSSVYGDYSSEESTVRGKTNVGGAIGKISNAFLKNDNNSSGIYVDFTGSPWTIEGTVSSDSNANVGGAVGFMQSYQSSIGNNYFPITVLLGKSNLIAAGSKVGGAVGYNYKSLNGATLKVQLDVSGIVSGNAEVGGVIGYNLLDYNYGAVFKVDSTINGNIEGTGDNVGGAIGYNFANVTNTNAVINGTITTSGDNVGGAIGLCHSNHRLYEVTNVTAKIQGTGSVNGRDAVGGAIGKNYCNIITINASISGNAEVNGRECIGGALGFASAAQGVVGNDILFFVTNNNNKDKCYGRILNTYVNISADHALSGKSRIGGAVGQVGEKTSSTYNSACLVYVEATLNSAYLFDPDNTGYADSDSCIGGIVGIFVDGRLGMSSKSPNHTGGVVLKGTGGVVKTAQYVDTEYFPARTYRNAVFIGAKGSSIGGLVGQIGLDGFQQNVCLANLSVVNDGPDLCVVSLNGKDRIGGWIGSGYAGHGGIGAEDQSTFNTTPVTYNVHNVKAVISVDPETGVGGSEIGGFCGGISCYNKDSFDNNKFGVFAYINVDLSDSNIIGGSKVGGAFGKAAYARFKSGGVFVTMRSYTNVGDIRGNALPGDTNSYTAVCYEAGGAIGSVEQVSTKYNTFHAPVEVTIDSTSRVCGLAVPATGNAADYGVGGAFGELQGKFSNDIKYQWIRVTAEDGNVTSIHSKATNAGGIAGVIKDNELCNAFANVTVRCDADNCCVGGIAGRVVNTSGNKIINCHFGPDETITKAGYFSSDDLFGDGAVYDASSYRVIYTGSSGIAGGFIGSGDNSVTMSNCYTTATVSAPNASAAGGFAGKVYKGSATSCYVGGHTYSKHYISNSADVIGTGNVGGFVGQITGDIVFDKCYSTASVYGSGSNVGGFVGSSAGSTQIKNSYCTGMVRCTDEASRGTFVGKSTNTTYTSCAAMTGVNKNMTLAGGGSAISGLTSQTAAEIKGSNNHKAHPFDKALGPDYDLRAVINSEHWGDWPEADDDRKNIADCLIVLNPTEYEYSKSGYKLEDYLSITDGDNPPLVYGEDYTLEYQNANKVGDKATVIISGINDYYGAISKTFTITTKKLLQSDVYDENSNPDGNIVISIGYPAGSENGFEYSGAPNAPESTVTLGTDVLTEGIDYYLEYDPDNINIGTVNVTVVGHGNYEGRLENVGTFEIIGRNLADAEVTLLNATEEELVYDGNPKEPGVIVRINGKTLTRDVDYRVEFVCEEFKDDPDPDKRYNHTDVGTVIVLILPCEGNDQYSGQNDKTTFKITQATNVILLEPEISGWTWNSTPSALTRELTATFGSDTAVYSVHTSADCSESSRLVGPCSASELQDAMKILDAGNYYLYAVVAATDNWTEVSKIVPFTVDPWNFTDNVTIELAYTSVAYDGNPHEPDVTVKYNGDETLDVSNYTVSYDSDTTSVGTKTITITGKNNCIGTASATYEIIPVWTVTFDTAGGSLGDQENPVTVPDGQTVTEPQDPTYDGYRFDGWYWYINPSSFVPYDFDMSVDSDLTLYATWTRLWDVTFIPDNGEGNIVLHIPDQTSIGDSKPEDPERVGYDFDGWYEKDEYGNYINKWSDSAFNALITQEYELYAKWIPQEHTVTFDTNEGSVIAPVTLTYPDPLTQPDDPERDGYRFAGWYSDPELNTEFTGFGSSVPEDKTIYAKWIKQWEVTFKLYEGKDDIVLKVDTNTVMTKPSDPTRDNFDFDGWYTDPELKNKYTEEDWAKPVTESFTLYAKWKPKGT